MILSPDTRTAKKAPGEEAFTHAKLGQRGTRRLVQYHYLHISGKKNTPPSFLNIHMYVTTLESN